MAPYEPNTCSECHYKTLGVDASANDSDIAKAYKKLALKHHPDKNPEDSRKQSEEAFKGISKAYSVLSDPAQRRAYDGARLGTKPSGIPRCGPSRTGGLSDEQADALFQSVFGSTGAPPRSTFFFDEPDTTKLHGSAAGAGKQVRMDDLLAGAFRGLNGHNFAPDRRYSERQCTPKTPPDCALSAGTAVVVRGLEKSTLHNGKAGRIKGFDFERGRYTVSLAEGAALSLRPQNLTQQCQVELVGLGERPDLNGKRGDVVSYDAKMDQYVVMLHSPPLAVSASRSNCILAKDTCVVLLGLSQERYNTQMAKIIAVHREEARYSVSCQSGETIKVKYDKAIC